MNEQTSDHLGSSKGTAENLAETYQREWWDMSKPGVLDAHVACYIMGIPPMWLDLESKPVSVQDQPASVQGQETRSSPMNSR